MRKLWREDCAPVMKRAGVKNRLPVFHTFLSAFSIAILASIFHQGGRTFCRKTLCRKTFCRKTFCRTDTLPTDFLPNGRFAERTFCRTDSLANGQFDERTTCRIQRYLVNFKVFAYLVKVSVIKVIVDYFDDRNFDSEIQFRFIFFHI